MNLNKVKHVAIPLLYVVAVMAFVSSMFFIQKVLTDAIIDKDIEDFELVPSVNPLEDDDNGYKPVIAVDNKIIKPYTDTNVKEVRGYYDYKSEANNQEGSLIYFENTYMQNSGIDYQGTKPNFDIVSIYDGTVIEVKEDNLLGKVIQIRHSNDMISIYQSLSEIVVKENDTIKAGTIIGKSGTSNISSSLGNHLHFELLYKGQVVNPNDYYDKKITEL